MQNRITLYNDEVTFIRAELKEDGWHIYDEDCEYQLYTGWKKLTVCFKTIIPALNQDEIFATICRQYSSNNDEKWGIIKIDKKKKIYKYTLSPSDKYDFIDGLDHGITRAHVCSNDNKASTWGIIDFNGNILTDFIYTNIWGFYGKNYKIIRAELEGKSVEINIEDLFIQKLVSKGFDDQLHCNRDTNDSDLVLQSFNSVSFENFKKFVVFPEFDTSGNILFFVGQNNAGKSSFFSAVRVVMANIRYLHFTERNRLMFSFHEADLCTSDIKEAFQMLKCRNTNRYEMLFSSTIGDCLYEFHVDSRGEIFDMKFYHKKWHVNMKYNCSGCFAIELLDKNYKHIIDLKKSLSNISSKEKKNKHAIDIIKSIFDIEMNSSKSNRNFAQSTYSYNQIIEDTLNMFYTNAMYCVESVHIPLFLANSNDIIIRNDNKNTFLFECVKDFYKVQTEEIHAFVNKWIDRMDIGKDFEIKKSMQNGHFVYSVLITDKNNKKSFLNELGSGSAHFILLCLKLISIIFMKDTGVFAPIIEIEEPEQNLHPRLQSHLANFFLDLSNFYQKKFNNKSQTNGLKLLIETHSEYMIRRSQVLVKLISDVQDFSKNPFKTFYFPSDHSKAPYSLEYKSNGHFVKSFDPGFTDESSMLALQIL